MQAICGRCDVRSNSPTTIASPVRPDTGKARALLRCGESSLLELTEMTTGNRNMNKAVFLTADQLEKLADAAASQASHLLEGEERRNALSPAARLRVNATMKRALTPPTAKLK
jgi:hypothetical protein